MMFRMNNFAHIVAAEICQGLYRRTEEETHGCLFSASSIKTRKCLRCGGVDRPARAPHALEHFSAPFIALTIHFVVSVCL